MTRYRLDPEQLTAEACKRRAAEKMADVHAITLHGDTAVEMRRQFLAEAQVWATLATVPEPLEELTATAELIAAPTLGARFPLLKCPHGFALGIEPQEDGSLQYQEAAAGCARCT